MAHQQKNIATPEGDRRLYTAGNKKFLWNLEEFTLTRSLWKRDVLEIHVVWFWPYLGHRCTAVEQTHKNCQKYLAAWSY